MDRPALSLGCNVVQGPVQQKGLSVGPVVLGVMVFLILGSSLFELLRAFQSK